MIKPLLSICLVIFSALFQVRAHAGQITKVNLKQAIVDLQGDLTSVGEEFYVINAAGKKIAIMSVEQIKGDRALMTIKKGRPAVGNLIEAKPATEENKLPARDGFQKKKSPFAGGALFGYAMSTMSMRVQNGTLGEDIKMSDSSYSLKAFVDYDLSPSITIRAASGYETFAAKGSLSAALCTGSTSCQANYTYLPFEGSLHYNFLTGAMKAWVGLGYSYLMEIGRNVNIPNLNTESKTNQMILLSAGADLKSGNNFIPLALDYITFPGSTNVSATAMHLRAGYGFPF